MSYPYSVSSKSKLNQTVNSGFGLIELMVSISIMVIVAGIILSRQNSFNGAVLLRGQAYEIAFQLRDTQLQAVSVSNAEGGAQSRSVLGINFSENSATNQRYTSFRDANGNGFYDAGEQVGVLGIIDNRFEVREIRAVGDSVSGDDLSVVFVRPNFDARFFDMTGEVDASSIEIDIARIGADSGATGPGDLRTIEVTATGQIGVR